ncbi:MAG: type II secretion system F family protein [Herminiimonas sp.]|nr:type II secretion system F family protein [Herminiimonas sp.]
MDPLYSLFGLVTFVAVLLLIGGVYSSWHSTHGTQAKRMKRRLADTAGVATAAESDVSIRKQRVLSKHAAVQHLLSTLPQSRMLDQLLLQSGTTLNVAQFGLVCIGVAVASALLLMLASVPTLVAVTAGAAASAMPVIIMMRKKRARIAQIEQQLPDALDLMSRALRAGHALPSAIKMVGDEVAAPLGAEFRIMSDEINYGISAPDALKNLLVRVPGIDLGYFVVAALIQRETGGNLTELLTNIAGIVRERLKLFGAIKVLTAEGRLSAWILGLMPFGLTAVLQVINPAFMKVLWTDPAGRNLLIGMAVFMVIGTLWIRKLVRLRV